MTADFGSVGGDEIVPEAALLPSCAITLSLPRRGKTIRPTFIF
jgi:hypothetical protein